MAGTTFSATLDGVNNFSINGDNFIWGSNGYLSNIDEWGGDGPTVNTFDLTFQGGGWDVGNLHLGGWAKTNIVDSLDGLDRNIETLRLSGIGGTVNLTTTHVEVLKMFWIDGGGGTNITFGSAGADEVLLNDGDDMVRGGSGWLDDVRLGGGNNLFVAGSGGSRIIRANDGNDTVTGGAGNIDNLSLQSGNNVVNGGSGFIAMIRTFGGNDRVTLSGGADAISLGSGNDRVVTGNGGVGSITLFSNTADVTNITVGAGGVRSIGLSNAKDTVILQADANVEQIQTGHNDDTISLRANAHIESLYMGDGSNTLTLAAGAGVSSVKGDNGDDTVTLNGSSRVFLMKLDGGNNTVTSDTGNIESLYSFGGNNTLNIGTGGVQQIVLSGDGTQHVTSEGFIGSLQSYDMSSTTAVLKGGAINVFTGMGADNITIGAGSFAASVITWDGNDTVTGGADTVIDSCHLDAGDDVLRLNTVSVGNYSATRGGAGIDLIDFSQNAAGVTISMNLNGAYQTLGAGKVSLIEFENLNGSTGADRLEGDGSANKINGLGGSDRIFGLAGADTLGGGLGADTLAGGAGADQFEFAAGGGKDRVTDFAVGLDHIHFAGSLRLADITFAVQGSGVLLTVGASSALVDGVTLAQLHDAANFVFG